MEKCFLRSVGGAVQIKPILLKRRTFHTANNTAINTAIRNSVCSLYWWWNCVERAVKLQPTW